MSYRLLVINPGSTSTKIAVFDDEKCILSQNIVHSTEELSKFSSIYEQYSFRRELVLNKLKEKNIALDKISAVIGRGGLLKPIKSGVYEVNKNMLEDLNKGIYGNHASNLGGIIANEIADRLNIKAYIVDPVVVDEMDEIARLSGIKEISRKSIFHALNQKAAAKRYARENMRSYEELKLIVCHMGGGISVGAHKYGRVIDVNNALDGEGPFSPERAGSLPVEGIIKLYSSNKYTEGEIYKKVVGKGGLVSYLNTNDAREVEKKIENGDEYARLIYMAMAYQISKEIAASSSVLYGEVDAIILTGGLAHSSMLVNAIKERVSFIGKIVIYKGEDEMLALAEGGLRALRGEERIELYL